MGKYYAILPQVSKWSIDEYKSKFGAKSVDPGFQYNSGTNEQWLTVEEIRELIGKHIGA
jgi:hypothetical protein